MPHIPDSRHADHDPLAIAAYAAGDATGDELDTARALVAACADCATLHADLRAISAALPELPVPSRPRDFQLTPEQAASLRPAGWRRLLAPLAGPRFAFAGPLGGGLATLGIAGLLVAGSLGAPLAATPAGGGAVMSQVPGEGSNSAPAPSDGVFMSDTGIVLEAPAESPDLRAMTGPAGTPVPSTEAGQEFLSDASPVPETGQVPEAARDVDAASIALPFLLPLVSFVALTVGLVLAGLRLLGRRVARG